MWRRAQVHADTSTAALPEIKDFIRRFGTDRLIFGSDHPFGTPAAELDKVLSLNLSEAQNRAILGDNFRRLCRLPA